MVNSNKARDDSLKYYSMVARLVHYTSKFSLTDDVRLSKQYSTTRNRLSSSLDSLTDKPTESRRFRLAPIWPEWDEAEINNETWDTGIVKKKDTSSARSRAEAKANISVVPRNFEDPEGKVELPPSLKVEQWKRPIDFLPPDKPPVIVDSDLGIQNFDLITSNEHLHHSEIMRSIISQITILWDIGRKERKTINTNPENIIQANANERTWRPWEHIYALNKVSKQAFITPYNPAGKYVVRLFFLGTWRKIIIDDSIPFDAQNRCLLPQTTLSYELWPMLLTKALLKIITLDFNASGDLSEYSEASIIHLLTGWIPEPIPVKYTYAEKIWHFLRYGHPEKHPLENESLPTSSWGPVPIYKWPNPNEEIPISRKNKRHSSKKTSGSLNPSILRSTNRSLIPDDQSISEESRMIVFATISHSQSAHHSSYSETADRSERLRCYNLNETFSTSVLVTSIRDIALEPPAPPQPSEIIPAWKLIRPRQPKILPHAEPIVPHEKKIERWIEIASSYISYPAASVLNMMVSTPAARSRRSAKHSATPSSAYITEVDEDEDAEQEKLKLQLNSELLRTTTSISLPTTKKELNVVEPQEKIDESIRSAGSKSKRETPIDKTKPLRKSAVVTTKTSSETLSTKSKIVESEPVVTPIDVPTTTNTNEQQISPSTSSSLSKKSNPLPKIWMDFNDFCSCFTSVIVFHNPRAYQFNHKHTEIKFAPYQPVLSPTVKEKKKESVQPVVQSIPSLQDDKSSLYLFIDSTRETLDKNIELIISLTCLPRWYDSSHHDTVVHARGNNAERSPIDPNLGKIIVSQKEIIAQMGSLIAEIYSWKSLSIGQPILRLHTTATKAALLTLPPGRHVLKLTNACPFAFNLNVLSNTNDFLLGDEDQLLNKISSVPEDAEFLIQAEELFLVFEESIENFHLINQQENKLYEFFRSVCQNAPPSLNLTVQTCLHAFHQALYSTLRTVIGTPGSTINAEMQFAWRCFTNDLVTPDILGAYEIKPTSKRFSKEDFGLNTSSPTATSGGRHSTRTDGRSSAGTSKRTGGNRERSSEDRTKPSPVVHSSSVSDVQEDFLSDWLNRESSIDEIEAITSIQKSVRGFLQRRIDFARKAGTQKNLLVQQTLKSTLSLLKADSNKSALLLFKNFISAKPQLIQCFSFRNDDWNMVNYRDYSGLYQEQPANTWFILFRDVFHMTEDGLIAAKLLSHLPNSLLRVINNDTYEEMPLVFNRLAPAMFTKNKNGYTFFAEGMSHDLPTSSGRFRLRLITSYTHLPEPRVEQIISSFITKEIMDYYLANKDDIICRYRVIVGDDANQTGRNFHSASIQFSTSKPDVFMRLAILDHDDEIVSVEGKGTVILPAILFMRPVSNASQPPSRPTSKTSHKKSVSSTHQGSVVDSTVMSKERVGSGKRSGSSSRTDSSSADADEKPHKYFIQVTLLRKSWPLTLTQWQFIEQEKNELRALNRQSAQTKPERRSSSSTGGKRGSQANLTVGKGRSGSVKGRLNTSGKITIDTTKPHWTLRVISDADKAEELTIKKDTERIEELINMKKAWETFQTGRAEKAMQTRQRFLDSLQPKSDEQQSTPEISDVVISLSDTHTDTEISLSSVPSSNEQIIKQTSSRKRSSSKKGSIKDVEALKQIELTPPQLQIDELLFNEPPPSLKPRISLPALDLQPFIRRKLSLNESILFTPFTEHEQFKHRRNAFNEYLNSLDAIREYREDDQNYRSNEKTRQLEEYVDLQGRIDQIRRCINEPREVFRQRFLEIERRRLAIIAAEQQRLLEEEKAKAAAAAAMIKPIEKKTSVGKKKKK